MSLEMYKEHILDLYKNPLNFGEIENPTNKFTRNNPTCGDVMNITLIVEEGIVKEVKFSGEGCAISQSSASMVTEKVKGMKIEEIK